MEIKDFTTGVQHIGIPMSKAFSRLGRAFFNFHGARGPGNEEMSKTAK